MVCQVKLIFGHAHGRNFSLPIKFIYDLGFVGEFHCMVVIESFLLCVKWLSAKRINFILLKFGCRQIFSKNPFIYPKLFCVELWTIDLDYCDLVLLHAIVVKILWGKSVEELRGSWDWVEDVVYVLQRWTLRNKHKIVHISRFQTKLFQMAFDFTHDWRVYHQKLFVYTSYLQNCK